MFNEKDDPTCYIKCFFFISMAAARRPITSVRRSSRNADRSLLFGEIQSGPNLTILGAE
jgi:hypothetical protein